MTVVDTCLDVRNDPSEEDDGVVRTGTTSTCVSHIITSVIGSGILSLAWSTAQLGWIGGPVCMILLAIVTYVSVFLLSNVYRTPDSIHGGRNKSYIEAVKNSLGTNQTWVCGLLQYVNLYGTGVAYTITASISLRAIQRVNCYHQKGSEAPCEYSDNTNMYLFGIVQIFCCFIPDFNNLAWLSGVAALMSFCYSSIAIALGFAKTIGDGQIKGNMIGIPAPSSIQRIWNISQAVGDIAFAYPYSLLLLEIQDTLKSPPAEKKTMRKASIISIPITTVFYLLCSCFGYAAFGNDTPGNLLTGFGFYEPFWLIDFANACVILHLIGGYQIYSQPIFAFADIWFAEKYPNTDFVNTVYPIPMPFSAKPYNLILSRLTFRTIYVVTTTIIAILFPYFNQVLGILGALNFWPLTVYFPVEMYILQNRISTWSRKWVLLQTFSAVCFIVSLFALVGSVEGVIKDKLQLFSIWFNLDWTTFL